MAVTPQTRATALTKLAFFGTADVPGTPIFGRPPLTVGQALYSAGSNPFFSGTQRRSIMDSITGSGIGVNSPAKSLLRAGIGALAGNFVANLLHTGPFLRGVMTATGANYGYNH